MWSILDIEVLKRRLPWVIGKHVSRNHKKTVVDIKRSKKIEKVFDKSGVYL